MDKKGEQTMPSEIRLEREVEKKKGEEWPKLMDMMEEGVPTTGQFFVKVGSKKELVHTKEGPTRYEDTRALILRAHMLEVKEGTIEEKEFYVVITRDGPKRLEYDNKIGKKAKGFLKGGIYNLTDRQIEEERSYGPNEIVGCLLKSENLFPDTVDGVTGGVQPKGYLRNENDNRGEIIFGSTGEYRSRSIPLDKVFPYSDGIRTIGYIVTPIKGERWLVAEAFEKNFKEVRIPQIMQRILDMVKEPQKK